MVWINSAKFETPKRYEFRLNDFTGGINNVVTESRIADNEASDLLNVRFEQDGVLKKRYGFTLEKRFSSLLHGIAGSMLRVFPVEPSGTTDKGFLLLVNGTRMVYITTKGEVKIMPWSRVANDVAIDGCQFGNYFFFVDGGVYTNMFKVTELEAIKKYNTDGSLIVDSDKVWHYLITKPPTGFTPAPAPAYKGVYKELPYPGFETKVKAYWYEPCAMELEDGYKGSNQPENFFASMIKVHKDRLYIAGNVGRPSASIDPDPNMIYISDVMNPFYFPATMALQTPPTGDKITCLREFNDALIVGRKDDVYAINGNTNRMDSSEQFTLKRINTHTGMANNYAADTIFNYLFYVGSDGNCYKLVSTTTSETLLATQQVNLKIDFKLPPFNKTLDQIKSCHTGYNSVRGEWFIQVGDETFIYNYRIMAWVRWRGVECMQYMCIEDKFYFIRNDGSFYIVDDEILYDTWSVNSDIKIPIQFYWVSKNIDFGMPSRIKQIRDTFLISEIHENLPSDIRIKYEADYIAVNKEHNISSEIALWDLALWDKHRFVYKNIIRSLPIIVGRRCRNFKVFLGNGYEFKGVVSTLPEPQNSNEGELYYMQNITPSVNLFSDTLVMGGIESTSGTKFDSSKHVRCNTETIVLPSSKYEIVMENKHPNLICSVLMYKIDGTYITSQYVSYDFGYIFETTSDTAYIRFSFTDATSTDDLTLQEVTRFELRRYLQVDLPDPLFPDGFYLRIKRNEDRVYYEKKYPKDLYQPVKIHELNGIYEVRGFR